jgi:hypothetical protein
MKTASLCASAALALSAAAWYALPAEAANATQQACSQQYQAAKSAGTLNGQKWTDFYSTCAANLKSGATPVAAAAPVAAPKAVVASPTTTTSPATAASASAGQSTQQICSGQYQAAKTAGTLNGQKWPAFYSDCAANIKNYQERAATTPAEPPAIAKSQASVASAAPAAIATTDANGKPLSAGEVAFRQRIHTCSQEWQSEKSAGTLPAGSKWPQFWSACNTQLKAQG